MSYVNSVLQPGETVKYRGEIHWKVYLPGLALVLVAVAFFIASPRGQPGSVWKEIIGAIILIPGLALLFWAWFKRWTTEIAVTDRRIIYKTGFIQRHTIEMHMDKVESVDVDQTLLGRVFNYGDIVVRGTGATLEPFRSIGDPIGFRNHVTAA